MQINYNNLLKQNKIHWGNVADIASVISGYAFKSSEWKAEGIPVVKIKNISSTGDIDFSECSYVCKYSNTAINQFAVHGGEFVIAMTGATIGKTALIPIVDMCYINQRVGLFCLQNKKCTPYLYCTFNRKDVSNEIVSRGIGSAQPNISGKDIETINIPLPRNNIIKNFDDKYSCILDKILLLNLTNQKLKALKDLYLKKFFD